MTIKQDRMSDRIREILSSLLLMDVTEPALQGMTVTEVKLDNEIEYADVFVNALGDEAREQEVMAGLKRANGFLLVLEAEAEVGLTIGLEPPLAQAIEATRAIPDPSRRVFLLTRIAQVWETAGRPLEAVATFAEALAAGTPVIATKGAPWHGLAREGCGWWIDHGVEPLVATLAEAMDMERGVLRAKGAKGRAWMKRDFSWDRVAHDMLAVYGWVCSGSGMPGTVRLK
jgi:ribosome-binding factor A